MHGVSPGRQILERAPVSSIEVEQRGSDGSRQQSPPAGRLAPGWLIPVVANLILARVAGLIPTDGDVLFLMFNVVEWKCGVERSS
jgi:hypothetical protein